MKKENIHSSLSREAHQEIITFFSELMVRSELKNWKDESSEFFELYKIFSLKHYINDSGSRLFYSFDKEKIKQFITPVVRLFKKS